MNKNQITHKNHYIPRFYLKNWSADNINIYGYRLLVSNSNIPFWKKYSINKIGYHQDLYTINQNGEAIDEFEEMLDIEIENPAQESIKKVIDNKKLTNNDWNRLVRFLATQDLRTPLNYFESIERWNKEFPNLIENTVKKGLKKFKEFSNTKNHTTQPIIKSEMHEFDDLFDIQILHDKNELSLAVEMKLGRKMWIEVIKHHLKRNITTLLDHKWSIIKPYNGMSWFTSDHPVVKLEYSSDKEYNLKGGWGKQKTDIFMPLSPEHMMFTEIGSELPDSGEFSFEITYKFQKFIAEKAYRYIFSDYKNHIIPILKPRVVNKKLFEYEGDQWRSWHKNQSEAENK